jgi:hypothetical protein
MLKEVFPLHTLGARANDDFQILLVVEDKNGTFRRADHNGSGNSHTCRPTEVTSTGL